MNLSNAKIENLQSIMQIITEAQNYLASLHIDQWQNGYPDENTIYQDIVNNETYVVQNMESQIIGTAMFTTKSEPTYEEINGKWLTENNAKYGVVHRMAVGAEFRKHGIAKFIFDRCEQKLIEINVASLRVDTHKENRGMQNLLKTIGYEYCGIIHLKDGSERLAFEKIVAEKYN